MQKTNNNETNNNEVKTKKEQKPKKTKRIPRFVFAILFVLGVGVIIYPTMITVYGVSTHKERSIVLSDESNITSGVCYLLVTFPSGAPSTGTGFVIDDNKVVTAAHVLYNPDKGGYAKKVTVYPNQKFLFANKGAYHSSSVWVNEEYIPQTRDGYTSDDPAYDYGVVFLDKTLSNDIYRFSMKPFEDKKDNNISFTWIDVDSLMMIRSKGECMQQGNTLQFSMNAKSGSSGAPLYCEKDGKTYVVGINTSETYFDNETWETGAVLTEANIEQIKNAKGGAN